MVFICSSNPGFVNALLLDMPTGSVIQLQPDWNPSAAPSSFEGRRTNFETVETVLICHLEKDGSVQN